MASGWKSLQTLNTNQWGFRVTKVVWDAPSLAGHDFVITEPVSGIVLLQGTCDTANQTKNFDFVNGATWRDFKVTVLSSGTLFIWYRP